MPTQPIAGLVAVLAAADPATCDRVALTELAAGVQRVRSWLDALEATLSLHALLLGEPAVASAGGRRSAREASTVAARGELCATLPAVHDALAAGAVPAGHADAIARAVAQLADDTRPDLLAQAEQLVATATGMTVDRFERHMRDLARRLEGDGLERAARLRQQRSLRRWVDQHTGMCHTHVVLDPEADARFAAVFDAAVAAERSTPEADTSRRFEQVAADAFITSSPAPAAAGARSASWPWPISTRCATGCTPTPCARRSTANPCHPTQCVGWLVTRRSSLSCWTAAAPSWTGVRQTDGHPQATPGATGHVPHLRPPRLHRPLRRLRDPPRHRMARQRGPTDLADLLPLCSRHHHDVHDGGWQLTLHPDRTITLRRPDGTTYFDGSTIDIATTGVHTEIDLTRLIRQRAAALRVA